MIPEDGPGPTLRSVGGWCQGLVYRVEVGSELR